MAAKDTFIGYIDKDGIIWSQGYGAQKDIAIGIDTQAYEELKQDRDSVYEKAQKYLEELYTAGVRQRPKSSAEIAQEAAEQQEAVNKELVKAIKDLRAEIRDLRKSKKEEVVEDGTDRASGE